MLTYRNTSQNYEVDSCKKQEFAFKDYHGPTFL